MMFTSVFLSPYRLPKDVVVLLLLLIYFPVGICLMFIRIFIGVHVFLVSCALPESFVRRQVSKFPFTSNRNNSCSCGSCSCSTSRVSLIMIKVVVVAVNFNTLSH